MARILFAWEFGGEPGHARRLLSAASGLRALGHETAFAFRDLAPLGPCLTRDTRCFQAPWLLAPAEPDPHPANLSALLVEFGYGHPASLREALRAWLSIVELWRADAIVADFAPTAVLAARAARRRCITLGTGIAVPPPGEPIAPLNAGTPSSEAARASADARLLASIRDAFGGLDPALPAPATVSEVFAAEANLLCIWPEADPFGERANVEYLGPQPLLAAAHDNAGRFVATSTPAATRIAALLAD